MSYTEKMHKALRRDTEGKKNFVTDLLDEIERLTAELAELREMISKIRIIVAEFSYDRKLLEIRDIVKPPDVEE